MSLTGESVATTVYEGQKPGTSGLRKKVCYFEKEKTNSKSNLYLIILLN